MKNTEQLVNEILSPPKKKAANIPIEKLHTFNGHPFKVLDNEEMEILIESIRQQGILSPLIVRPMENKPDEYEVISGHRRLYASVKAGLTEVPALIYPLDRNAAIIAVVDSNIHREQILPSEKAFAYKMKMEAMKEQGKRTDLTLSQVATKSDTAAAIGKAQGESRDQVFRYIRLTNLIPEILQKVDEGAIALSPAVELSYLDEDSQRDVVEQIDINDCTPSHDQTIRMRKMFESGKLTAEAVEAIMSEEKPNQRERIVLRGDRVRSLIPKNVQLKDTEDYVCKALEHYAKYLRHRSERDSR